ncbi:hypothetical protein D3C74_205210 [compost metagenome]
MRVHLALQKVQFRPYPLGFQALLLDFQLIDVVDQRIDPGGHHVKITDQAADFVTAFVDVDQIKLLVGYLLHMAG